MSLSLLHVTPARPELFEPDYDRIGDLASALVHEPQRAVAMLSFDSNCHALRELNRDLRQRALIIQGMSQGRVPRAAMMAQADQLFAALSQMKEAACELRTSVMCSQAIAMQGRISVMECLTKMLLFELEP